MKKLLTVSPISISSWSSMVSRVSAPKNTASGNLQEEENEEVMVLVVGVMVVMVMMMGGEAA